MQLFPPGGSAKNGADIRLCLDAVEVIARLAHIRTVGAAPLKARRATLASRYGGRFTPRPGGDALA